MRRISVSAHIELWAVVFIIMRIGISPYRNMPSGFHYETYIGISPYRTLCSIFYYDTYIGISVYRTGLVFESRPMTNLRKCCSF